MMSKGEIIIGKSQFSVNQIMGAIKQSEAVMAVQEIWCDLGTRRATTPNLTLTHSWKARNPAGMGD